MEKYTRGKPNCTCGHELYIDDTYDMGINCYTNNWIYKVAGHCPYCGKNYIWQEYYTMIGYSDLVEIEIGG